MRKRISDSLWNIGDALFEYGMSVWDIYWWRIGEAIAIFGLFLEGCSFRVLGKI